MPVSYTWHQTEPNTIVFTFADKWLSSEVADAMQSAVQAAVDLPQLYLVILFHNSTNYVPSDWMLRSSQIYKGLPANVKMIIWCVQSSFGVRLVDIATKIITQRLIQIKQAPTMQDAEALIRAERQHYMNS